MEFAVGNKEQGFCNRNATSIANPEIYKEGAENISCLIIHRPILDIFTSLSFI